jgi:hypothetical protein
MSGTQIIDLSIIIVSYNTASLLKSCIESIVKNTKDITYEIIVVDNASTDGSAEAVKLALSLSKGHPELAEGSLKIIQNKKNLGFAAGNNTGLPKCRGKYILLLNSDTKLTSNLLPEIVDWMDEHPRSGIATCMLKNTDGSIQGTGGYFPTLLRTISWMTIQDLPGVDKLIKPFHPMKGKSWAKNTKFYKEEKQLDWVTGAFFLMRKEVYKNVGNFDEKYFMYTEETDYCFRAKALRWQVWYLPQWSIVHIGGASGTSENAVLGEFTGVKLFYKKHYPKWQYPILRLFLKIGALIRMAILGILEGPGAFKTYAKAFIKA